MNGLRAVGLLIIMTVLTGVIYPLVVTVYAQLFFPYRANGSILFKGGQPIETHLRAQLPFPKREILEPIGSRLIAQKFTSPRYFWPRPSAVDYNPLHSGGSRLGPTSSLLAKQVEERRTFWTKTHPSTEETIPEDLLFASASGLDPHISEAAALYQLPRIAAARGWNEAMTTSAKALIESFIEHNPKVFPGEPGVNVLLLNLSLDKL